MRSFSASCRTRLAARTMSDDSSNKSVLLWFVVFLAGALLAVAVLARLPAGLVGGGLLLAALYWVVRAFPIIGLVAGLALLVFPLWAWFSGSLQAINFQTEGSPAGTIMLVVVGAMMIGMPALGLVFLAGSLLAWRRKREEE